MQNYSEIVAENAVKYVSPDGFFYIQILSEINFGLPPPQERRLSLVLRPVGPQAAVIRSLQFDRPIFL